MKTIYSFIIASLFLYGCSSNKKNVIDLSNFYDIPWGSSKELAKEIMLRSEGMKFLQNISNDTLLYFEGDEFFGIKTKNYDLAFANNKLYMGSINFCPEYNGEILPTYLKIKKNLIDKYGESYIEKEDVDPSKNNMDDLKKLKNGIGQMNNTWYFSIPNSKWKNGIILILMKGSDISVMYVNSEIFGSYREEINNK